MSRRFWVTLVLFSAFAPTSTHAQSQLASRAARDTLPEYVARSSLEAYNRHDTTALISYYDTVAVHELLGDSAGRFKGTPQQMYAGLSDYSPRTRLAWSSSSR